jgi:hypothetical protein
MESINQARLDTPSKPSERLISGVLKQEYAVILRQRKDDVKA